MYKHILIPTDGSETADKAVDAGLEFAKWAGAKVTLFAAMPPYHVPSSGELLSRTAESMPEFERRSLEQAKTRLEGIERRARAAGVEVRSEAVMSDTPWKAIVAAAAKNACDLIFIASHGRRGLSALVHGSETHEVLTHSTIPTMVLR